MTVIKLENINQAIIANMIRTTRTLDRAVTEDIATFGITKAQLDVMNVLHFSHQEKLRPSVIAEELGVSKANISGIISRLIKIKMIVCNHDPEDSRAQLIYLSENGKNILKKLLPKYLKKAEQAFEAFTIEEKEKLHQQLSHIELFFTKEYSTKQGD